MSNAFSSVARVVLALLVLCGVLGVSPSPAAAKTSRPFKGTVVGTWDNIFAALPPAFGGVSLASFQARCQLTHVGNGTQAGTLTLTPTDLQPPLLNPLIPGKGSVTITAANGDTITFDYRGILNAADGTGRGRFNITGGTGRFEGARGQGTFEAVIKLSQPANQPMTVVLDGRITY